MDDRGLDPCDLTKFYRFAVWMLGDRATALQRAAEVIRARPSLDFMGWAWALLQSVTGPRAPDRSDVLGDLDDVLRTDLTVTVGNHPQVRSDPRRLRVLQWELKRSCLLAVMRGVAPGPRATFILVRIFGLTPERVAAAYGITEKSIAIYLGRAEKTLDDYLFARCEHIAPSNACHCDTRLGVALEREFVMWPEDSESLPETPVFSEAHSSARSLYRSLPPFTPDRAGLSTLTAATVRSEDG